MPQDNSRDLTPVVPKKCRSSYMWLMLCMMFTAALLALNIDFKFELMGCILDIASPDALLVKLANLLIGGAFYICLLKRGEKQALVSSLVFVLLGLLVQMLCSFIMPDEMLSTAVLMLGLGALSMACANTVLALGSVKTALRRLSFSLVLIPIGCLAGTYLSEATFIAPIISQALLFVLGLCFLLKSRSLEWERQDAEPSPNKRALWRYILCWLMLVLCFFLSVYLFDPLAVYSNTLYSLGIIPAFWLGFICCKKGWDGKIFWLAPILLLFTPPDAFLQPLGIYLPHAVTGTGLVYFYVALAFPMLVHTGLKGYEASPARLWALYGFVLAIATGLSLELLPLFLY